MAEGPGGMSAYERLRKIQAVSDAALGHLSLDALLDELLDRIRDALEGDTCAILLLDEERNELVARAARGIEEEVERGVRIPVGQGFAGRIAAERRPVAIEDVDHADVLNPTLREKGIKSLLGAPLLARERVLGVVHVGTLSRRRFSREDAELLVLVAGRVALALERALIHEELLLLDALKREFVSTAAHEIRTPAGVIYGIAKTLSERRDSLDPATLDELLNSFYDASTRLVQLADDLLSASQAKAEARISVEDRGPGVPQAFRSRLFEAFARASEAHASPGAGLGLAIARSYARQLGGDLVYEPANPTGARFTLVLPQPNGAPAAAAV